MSLDSSRGETILTMDGVLQMTTALPYYPLWPSQLCHSIFICRWIAHVVKQILTVVWCVALTTALPYRLWQSHLGGARDGMYESSVFRLSLKPANKLAGAWGNLGSYIPIPWLMYRWGIDGLALLLMSWIRAERIVVQDEPNPPCALIVWIDTDGMLDQIAFDVLSSVVLAVMIKIHVCSEPSGLSATELTICLYVRTS